MLIAPPAPDEYAPYYGQYISEAPGDDALSVLSASRATTAALLAAIPAAKAGYRYAAGKWTVREVVGHLSDTERIFCYRLLRIARGDMTPLASFDENVYVPEGRFEERSIADVAAEFATVRDATLSLLRSLDPARLERRGIASNKPVSARALAWITAGHELHHVRVLQEKYLG
ncbi:MAG: DinB family protein [Gemmatimonadota bacterium]|nr:DinB family protein [Gemmatimonadota bacterium]